MPAMVGIFLLSQYRCAQTYRMRKQEPRTKTKEYVWSPELAYAVGLITTDGCLSPDGRHLTLVSKDIEQLQNMKRILGLKVKIGSCHAGRKEEGRSCTRIQWGDVVLYRFLMDIGLMPNKSLIIAKVAIPDEYFFDFLRGHYDGDGSFYSYFDPRWKTSYMFYLCFTSGSRAHLEWIRDTLFKLLGVRGCLSTHIQRGRKNSFYQLKFAKHEAMIILVRVYHSANVICLSRKRLKIEKALGIVGLSLSSI